MTLDPRDADLVFLAWREAPRCSNATTRPSRRRCPRDGAGGVVLVENARRPPPLARRASS
jgi:hypothetical protein